MRTGLRTLTVTGVDGNDLLRRRIVAYAAGAAQAEMTDQSDDMCRAIVLDNLGSDAADGAADQQHVSEPVRRRTRMAASLTKAFARRNVLTVLQDIADIAATAGTPIYWHMVDADAPASGSFAPTRGNRGWITRIRPAESGAAGAGVRQPGGADAGHGLHGRGQLRVCRRPGRGRGAA